MGKQAESVELVIDGFSNKGLGVGKIHTSAGEVSVHVPGTTIGDRVCVQLLKRRRGVYRSRLLKLLSPSSERVEPRCSHFGLCGGCQWQHIPYESQLSLKQRFVDGAFKPYCARAELILSSDFPWHYRNKMEFTFSTNAAGTRYLGLMIGGSRGYVFNLEECPLTTPWFSQVVEVVRQWWEIEGIPAFHPHKGVGALRYLTLRHSMRTGDCMVTLTVTENSLEAHQKESFVQAVKRASVNGNLSCVLREQRSQKGQPTTFHQTLLLGPAVLREQLVLEIDEEPCRPLTFRVHSSAFFQPNTRQAERLYSTAIREAGINRMSVVYDLYCGTGTLSLCAALVAKEVWAIELVEDAIVDAKCNAQANGIDNAHFFVGDVGSTLGQWGAPKPDVVFVDPPRAGLDDRALEALKAIRAPKIVYISCNPATQAENVGRLIEAGYRIRNLIPIDQFPHTVHVENIAILEKL